MAVLRVEVIFLIREFGIVFPISRVAVVEHSRLVLGRRLDLEVERLPFGYLQGLLADTSDVEDVPEFAFFPVGIGELNLVRLGFELFALIAKVPLQDVLGVFLVVGCADAEPEEYDVALRKKLASIPAMWINVIVIVLMEGLESVPSHGLAGEGGSLECDREELVVLDEHPVETHFIGVRNELRIGREKAIDFVLTFVNSRISLDL